MPLSECIMIFVACVCFLLVVSSVFVRLRDRVVVLLLLVVALRIG